MGGFKVLDGINAAVMCRFHHTTSLAASSTCTGHKQNNQHDTHFRQSQAYTHTNVSNYR